MAVHDLAAAEKALAAGDFQRGETLLRRILVSAPRNARALELMAYVRARRGDAEGSLERLIAATQLPGATASAWYALGVAHRQSGDLAKARGAFEASATRDPDFFPAHHDLGTLLTEQGRAKEGLAALEHARTLAPNSFEAHHNRGRALQALGRHAEALEAFDTALAIQPLSAASRSCRGEALCELRRYPEALADFAAAVEIAPGYEDALWNEALTRLLLGEFEAGWDLYEYRFRGARAWPRKHTDIPAWDGRSDVRGKRVLVWWEQGFGDTLHFCRYIPLLVQRGAHVIFEAQRPLAGLMRSLEGGATVVPSGDELPAADLQVPLLTLPRAFATRLATIPAQVPYLRADPARVSRWEKRLALGPGRHIAVASSGNLAQKDNVTRSMALESLAPLARMATLHIVQPDLRAEDRDFARASEGRVRLYDEAIEDFDDSAAIVSLVDAVVTVDTALAHLAGALARPTWILMPWAPTWRWLVDREDTPWYPTARLVRQKNPGDWSESVARVVAELAAQGAPVP